MWVWWFEGPKGWRRGTNREAVERLARQMPDGTPWAIWLQRGPRRRLELIRRGVGRLVA